MLSSVLITIFAGSAMGISCSKAAPPRVQMPQMPQTRRPIRAVAAYDLPAVFTTDLKGTADFYECGVCGGAADGCPACRGPTPTTFEAFNAAIVDSTSAQDINQFECGVCGGAVDGCPACRGPTAPIYQSFSA